jgi:hypothetical protein
MYEKGQRAYIREGVDDLGGWESHIVMNPDGSFRHYENNLLPQWYALRAYQDEQRKKGEPIVLPEYSASWHGMDYGTHDLNFMFFSENRRPIIHAYEVRLPGKKVARFTNFRWRPGHGPKPLQWKPMDPNGKIKDGLEAFYNSREYTGKEKGASHE